MPGLRGDLSIRVYDGRVDRVVTRYCRGLKFTKVAPGGHQSLSFQMTVPRNMFSDLGPEDRVYVYDARTGRTMIEGYLENPTPVDGPDGQQFDILAMGGMALASDETRPLVYVDKNLDNFGKDAFSLAAADADAGIWVGDNSSKRERVTIGGGAVVATNAFAGADCSVFLRAGMTLGAFTTFVQSGKIDTNYRASFVHSGATIDFNGTTITTAGNGLSWFVGTDFSSGINYFSLRLRRVGGATTVGDDSTWTDFVNLAICGQRMDRYGALLTGSTGMVYASQVLASQVVEDLLGRVLTMCDPATAQVDTTTFGIDQLSWPDGIKAADVFTQLAVFEPNLLWEILETNDIGKHRFNYRTWPTSPRYVVSVRDGWQQNGSDVDLCNRILVSWTDATGNQQSTTVTATSLGLSGIGLPVDALGSRIKDADPISLPDGLGSSTNATQIGGASLTDKINPPKAGTVTVKRPVLDLLTGTTVMPWEIEAGYLCRVRETGDDLRITQASYDDDSCSMQLTLGTPVLTIDQRLARLSRAA